MMDVQTTVAQRLELFIDYLKIKPTAFARLIGVQQPAISLVLTGRRKSISVEMLDKITKRYTELNGEWLLYGRGEMLKVSLGEKKYPEAVDLDQVQEGITNRYARRVGEGRFEWMERTVLELLDRVEALEKARM